MNMQKIPLLFKVVFLHLSAFVLISFAGQFVRVPVSAQVATMPSAQITKKAKLLAVRGEPVRLKIPRLGIDLAVIDGIYDQQNQTWTLSDTEVQFARSTSLPSNAAGNTFIYGHNTAPVLGKTVDLQPGDELIVESENKKAFVYRYTSDKITTPEDTSVFSAEYESPVLTLLTCSGFWSQDRRLMFFEFVEVR
jgi:LPXTG-site transpeptidase (sortase) family protein